MDYRLVALDCDGTLLGSDGNIPEDNIFALRRLKEKGVEIVLATGRSDLLTKDYVEDLGIDTRVIGCNGATLSNVLTGKRLYVHKIDNSVVKSVLTACIRKNIPCKAFTADMCYTSDKIAMEKGIRQIVTMYTRELKTTVPYQWLSDEDMIKLADTADIVKMVTVNEDSGILAELKAYLGCIDGLQVIQSNRNCLDMIAPNVSKGNALCEYAYGKGIDMSECVAFGDSENDLSMIKAAGLGIAMANADECVKKAADIVTLTNDECGVAYELKKLFGINWEA